jgi:hypothetical protein
MPLFKNAFEFISDYLILENFLSSKVQTFNQAKEQL